MSKRQDKVQKTNAMRELERGDVAYELHTYDDHGDTTTDYGLRVAQATGQDPDATLKTLVCVSPAGHHVVCVVPVRCEIDLKKAAAAAGEKSLSLVPAAQLEELTGYVRGGCTAVGMKKAFPTLIDECATLYERVGISGGRRGVSLVVDPQELAALVGATFADIVRAG